MALVSEGQKGAVPPDSRPIGTQTRRARFLGGLILLLGASEVLYLRFQQYQVSPYPIDQFAGTTLLLFILYLLATFLLLRFSESGYSGMLTATWLVVVASAVFRVSTLPLEPSLSDDLYRYRWEGMLQSAGGNPYQSAPDSPDWISLRDDTYQKIPVKEFPGGYGPITTLLERASYELVRRASDDPFVQAKLSKWPSALGDIAIVILLAGWLRTRGKPVLLAAIYALCPLPILEFWGMGHNDALAIAGVIAAFWAMDARREGLAFAFLGLAVAVKWWPALLLPAMIGLGRDTPRRILWAGLGLCIVPVAFLPYWSDVAQNAKFMGGFAGGWRNNDSLFGITYALSGENFDIAKWWTLRMIGALSLLAGVLVKPRERAALVVLCGTLLLSANCHPWYLTWLVPFLAFVPWPPLFLWIALSPLFYEVLIDFQILGVWDGSRPDRWLVYAPVFAMMGGYLLVAVWTRWLKGGNGVR